MSEMRMRWLTGWITDPSPWIDVVIGAAVVGAVVLHDLGGVRLMPAMRQELLPTMPQPVLNARAIKCTIVLDPAEVAQIVAPTASRAPSSTFGCPTGA